MCRCTGPDEDTPGEVLLCPLRRRVWFLVPERWRFLNSGGEPTYKMRHGSSTTWLFIAERNQK